MRLGSPVVMASCVSRYVDDSFSIICFDVCLRCLGNLDRDEAETEEHQDSRQIEYCCREREDDLINLASPPRM